jgi:uncharacterized protein DUF5666
LIMNSSLLRVGAIFILFFAMIPAGATLASSENEVKFSGIVESLPNGSLAGDWRVGGRTVHVTSTTIINQEDGSIRLGANVKVEGAGRGDGSVDASSIELQQGAPGNGDITFKGTVQSFPNTAGFVGAWVIGGRTIHVIASTRIETNFGPVGIGVFVEVEGALRPDGSMDAVKIEIKSNPSGDDGRDELMGMIESLPGTAGFVGDWRVSGRAVHVTASTVINREHGSVAVGALVEVKGTQHTDGSMDALTIEIKFNPGGDDSRDQLMGTIDSLPGGTGVLVGDWLVSGRTVHVTAATVINREHGAVMVGSLVEVKGTQGADGSIAAISIEVKTQADDSSGASGTVKGGIESLPASANLLGAWIVNGRTVHVTPSTKLKAEHGAFVIGKRVKVKGMPMVNGSVVANKILVMD